MSASKIQFTCCRVMPTASASSASCCPRSGRNPCENPKKSCALPPRWSVRRSPGSRASYHGARRHAARQQTWRARQVQKVTHQVSWPLPSRSPWCRLRSPRPRKPMLTSPALLRCRTPRHSTSRRANLGAGRFTATSRRERAAVSVDECCRASLGSVPCVADRPLWLM